MGVRWLLVILVPGLFGVAFVASALVTAGRERAEAIDGARVREVQVLEAIGMSAALFLAQNEMARLDTLVEHATRAGADDDLIDIAVFDEVGRIRAHSDPTRYNGVLSDAFTRHAIAIPEPSWRVEGEVLSVAVPAVSGLRWGTVSARISLTTRMRAVDAARRSRLLVASGSALLASLVLSVALGRTVARPLRLLADTVQRMGAGDLGARAPERGAAEIAAVGRAFNRMATTLQAERQNLERAVEERTAALSEANSNLELLAVQDGLTGLYNHRRFQEDLGHEIARGLRTRRPLSLLMIDVDHFKRLNDTHGHPAGDRILRELAGCVVAAVRCTDICSRYGGEEFAVLLPETGPEEAALVAERTRAAVEQRFNEPEVRISVGVATWKADAPCDVLEAADRALYAAKTGGRNRVVSA